MAKTKKQAELLKSFLSAAGDEQGALFSQITGYLDELGYYPQKGKSSLSFKHDLHNKQIAKIGFKKAEEPGSFLALRFSACKGYSQRFIDIVGAAIIKYPHRTPRCIDGGCSFCAGEPSTHIYTKTFPNLVSKSHCGAYALEIPSLSAEDIGEIRELIKEEHAYLLEHEARR